MADSLTSGSIARAAASRVCGPKVVVAPTLPFGFSPQHASHPSTMTLRLSTYLATVGDLARGLVASGFPRVLIVNGHGGKSAPLRSLVVELVTDGLARFVEAFAATELRLGVARDPTRPLLAPKLPGA